MSCIADKITMKFECSILVTASLILLFPSYVTVSDKVSLIYIRPCNI